MYLSCNFATPSIIYPSLPALQIETKIEPWLLTKYAILVYICVRVCVRVCVVECVWESVCG